MKMNKVVEVLNNNGIKAELSVANKGGKNVDCVRFGEGRVTPTAYEPTWDSLETEADVVEFARKTLANTPDINMDMIFSRDYVLANAVTCIRHETDDDKTLRYSVFGDLEEYFRIPVRMGDDQNGSIVVLRDHLKSLGIEPDELREAARNNLRRTASIENMRTVLAKMMGADLEEIPDIGEEFMYVGSTESRTYGASVILLDDVLREFCNEHDLKSIQIIPSSVHEVILIPDEHEESVINEMIGDVNNTQISDETDILSDHIYRFVA